MAKSSIPLTQERLKQVLDYNPDTGNFTRKNGRIAGSLDHGYIRIMLYGERHYAQRLAFLCMTGKWPDPEADHKDKNSINNAWLNLREATGSQNQYNKSKLKNNTSGFKGVYWHKQWKKWNAKICVSGKPKHIGCYGTPEEAHAAYCAEAIKHHGKFARV